MTGVMQDELVTNPSWGSEAYSQVATSRYTSSEFARLENEHLWPQVWQVACRLEEIPDVGDYLEYEIAGRSFLVVRVGPDSVKAYVNACLHRGTQLKKGCGHATNLTCPFHAWCWELDGSLNHILSPEDFPGLTAGELDLPECRVALWAGFVFLNPALNPQPFEEFIEPLEQGVAPYRVGDQRFMSYRGAVLPCNWKTGLEAFEEAYHLQGTHPQQLAGVDDVNTVYETCGPHSIMVLPFGQPSSRLKGITEEESLQCFLEMVINAGSAGEDQLAALETFRTYLEQEGVPEGVTARQVFVNLVKAQVGDRLPDLSDEQMSYMWEYTVFPNTIVSCLPGQTAVIRTRPYGNDPDSCIFEMITLHLFGDGESPPQVTPEWLDDPVRDGWPDSLETSQDMLNLPKIQAGMHARPFVRLAGYQEKKIVHRHRILDEYLPKD